MQFEYPDQRVSRDTKLTDSFFKPTYDHLINRALSLNNNKEEIKTWLNAANGIIDTSSLNYLISPLKNKENNVTNELPGKIRETDLITTVRERNIGEYIGLPYKFTVNVFNPDSVLRRDLEVREEVNKLMQQALINMLNEHYEKQTSQINTGVESKEVPDIEKFVDNFLKRWIDKRAINGLNILKLINEINDFDTKRLQCFFYWWACEEFYTYREIINNEVYTSVLSPLEGYPIFNDEQYVEDYTAFVIKKKTTLTKVKSLYWKEFTEEEKRHINQLAKNHTGNYSVKGEWLASRTWDTSMTAEYKANAHHEYDVTDNSESLDEYTILWRTEVPVKIRKFVDPFGNEREEVVPEDYVQTELDTEVVTEWIEEVYVGKRFGNAISGIYLKPHPCDAQRYDRHTLSPKLPVGGKKGILRNIIQNPISKRLLPYVIIDRMILLEQERAIAQFEPYIKIIPQSMLNSDSVGTKVEKMFYIKADRTLVYDDSTIDFNTVAQGFRVVGMPEAAQYLNVLIQLRDKYKAEGLEIANMNDYSLGDVNPSTGKGVMQESIYRARLGNVLSITMFNAALERDHMADLEFSKVAYQDNVRGSFTDRSSGKPIYIDVNLEEHRETDYGVTVENSKVDQKKLDQFIQLAFNASQNGDIDSAVAAIDNDSVPEIREALREISEAQKKVAAKIEEDRNATQRYVSDQAAATAEANNATTRYVADKKAETDIYIAELEVSAQGTETEPNLDNSDKESKLALQRDQLEFKRNDSNQKNDLKDRQIRATERLNREKLKLAKNKPNTKS